MVPGNVAAGEGDSGPHSDARTVVGPDARAEPSAGSAHPWASGGLGGRLDAEARISSDLSLSDVVGDQRVELVADKERTLHMDRIECPQGRWRKPSRRVEQLGVEVDESQPREKRVGGSQLVWGGPKNRASQFGAGKVRRQQDVTAKRGEEGGRLRFLNYELGQRRRIERNQERSS